MTCFAPGDRGFLPSCSATRSLPCFIKRSTCFSSSTNMERLRSFFFPVLLFASPAGAPLDRGFWASFISASVAMETRADIIQAEL